MGRRDAHEPPYPQTRAEVDAYCAQLIDMLTRSLGDRLRCVLLGGSWARGEARPPTSDVDITVIIDDIDTPTLYALRAAWEHARFGNANIYTQEEVATMSHIALEMYTTNAEVVWGTNPFPIPTRFDIAEECAQNIESVARYARHLMICYWRTPEEIQALFPYLLGDLTRLMQNMVALRSGQFPKNRDHFQQQLVGTDEETLLAWCRTLDPEMMMHQRALIAERVNTYIHACVTEISPTRKAFFSRLTS
jgi:hypothetical protein